MGTADKITFMYAVNGAYFPTFTARNTLVVIYAGKVVYDLDCLGGTGPLTLAASYTAVLAELSDLYALVVIVTLNYNAGYILYEMDYTVGAYLSAKTAADTFLRVYLGYAALGDAYRISGAHLSAVSVAKASEGAKSVACIVHIRSLASLRAGIDIFSLLGLTRSVTSDVSNLLNDVLSLNAENGGNSLGGSVTAGSTKIRLIGYALGERLCVALAARKAASSAVCSGKTFAYLICSLVLFNTEIAGSESKKQGANDTYAEKKKDRN